MFFVANKFFPIPIISVKGKYQ
ncbi:hypothetical protein F383_14842 [Gossypium arboreum]|uniref:Uncharacterized protein n=1 Tax=Gossypium arboreum TaxID=29729 RepID=A0A0B0NDV6_GOSAR|nr:hypothetical protein F383_14842 [Gossypium arboreum]